MARVNILEKLMFHPGEYFYLSDLARATETVPIQASKELENLIGIGLVKKTQKGKMVFYSINKDNPIFPDLKNIFLKTDSLGSYLREKLKDYKLEYAIIFGSFAEGTESERSDVDLLIIGNVDENALLNTIHQCEKKISRDINYIAWNRKDLEKKIKEGIPLLETIQNKKIISIIGNEDEFREIIRRRANRKNK